MPRDTLTREQIVAATIDLLDAEGLEGFNIRALGERLGSAATAIYWHIGSKENLIVLSADRVWNEIVLPDLGAVEWRAAVAIMAGDLLAMLARHPWLLQAFGSFLLFGPGKARYDDYSLAIYEAAGFAETLADKAAATVFTFVLGHALGHSATVSVTRKLRREGGDPERQIQETLSKARNIASQFPRLRARLGRAAAGYGAAPDDSFEFGLQGILDTLEAQLLAQRASANNKATAETVKK